METLVWAVDLHGENPQLHEKSLEFLKCYSQSHPCTVEPIHVYVPDQLDLMQQLTDSSTFPERTREAEKDLQKDLSKRNLSYVSAPKVLVYAGASIGGAVDTLIKFATKKKADLILTSSHGRKGFTRLTLGSFAETLLNRCPIPMWVVNPHCEVPKKIGHILYATDFSVESRKGFEQLVRFCFPRKARITLCHVPRDASVSTADEEAERWVSLAKRDGVTATYLPMEDSGSVVSERLTGEKIIALASQSNVDAIGLIAHRGALAASLFGSVARQVIRHATRPVFVVHAP